MSETVSDDDDVIVPSASNRKVIHYGSLEETERDRLAGVAATDSPKPSANIATSSGMYLLPSICVYHSLFSTTNGFGQTTWGEIG